MRAIGHSPPKLDPRKIYKFQQRRFEDSTDYFTRVKERLHSLRAIDAQILDYFDRLHEARYGDCKHDYLNRAKKEVSATENIHGRQ